MHEIARQINPLLRGWIEYYGRYATSALHPVLRYINQMLLAWTMRKFKRFRARKIRASRFLQKLARENANLFVHRRLNMIGATCASLHELRMLKRSAPRTVARCGVGIRSILFTYADGNASGSS
jgi:hypothetical protein